MGKKNYEGSNYNYTGLFNCGVRYDPKDKIRNANTIFQFMLSRLRRMFKIEDLPETIPERDFILMLLTGGHGFFTKENGNYYFFNGSPGGKPDVYYKPTIYVVANPALNLSKTYKIDEDGVLIKCNSMWKPINELLGKYCYLIAENELTMDIVSVMSRSALVISAEDDSSYNSAMSYIGGLEKGNLGVITKDSLISDDAVKVQPGATTSAQIITNLIELNQYLKATMFNEFGLNANWNAKRETITSSESLLNKDTLWPLCDDIIETIREGLEKVNKMYDLNISIEYDSSWGDNEKEEELAELSLENQIENEVSEPSDCTMSDENEGVINEEVEVEDGDREGTET